MSSSGCGLVDVSVNRLMCQYDQYSDTQLDSDKTQLDSYQSQLDSSYSCSPSLLGNCAPSGLGFHFLLQINCNFLLLKIVRVGLKSCCYCNVAIFFIVNKEKLWRLDGVRHSVG